jgi:hypothetical protein
MKVMTALRSAALVLGLAALAPISTTALADSVKGHAGTTWSLAPIPGHPNQFTHTVDGLVRVSSLGNCTFHADVIVTFPTVAGQPLLLDGTFHITTADGSTTLDAHAQGTGTPDPANANMLNFHYDIRFAGGTGQMANARGTGGVDGFAMFRTEDSGIATWLLQANISTRGHGHDN